MDGDKKDQCICIFLRAPEKGKVKTRLSEAIDENIVLELYKNFAGDILDSTRKTHRPVQIYYYPPGKKSFIAKWIGNSYDLTAQQGGDLGERMSNAFINSFSCGYKHTILIGTDCPTISSNILQKAFKSLKKSDMVIGPALDGGYYLIGFNSNSFNENLFTDISWGSEKVFQSTMKKAQQKNLSTSVLTQLRDIDTFEDLKAFYDSTHNKISPDSRTYRFLKGADLLKGD